MRNDNNTDGMTAEELVALDEGTEVRVEYESVNGERGNTQAFEATVVSTEDSLVQGFLFGTVALKRDPEDLSRRRIKVSAESLTLEGRRTTRNGAVWGRLSGHGRGRPTVTLVEDESEGDEEDEEADIWTDANEADRRLLGDAESAECSRCSGTGERGPDIVDPDECEECNGTGRVTAREARDAEGRLVEEGDTVTVRTGTMEETVAAVAADGRVALADGRSMPADHLHLVDEDEEERLVADGGMVRMDGGVELTDMAEGEEVPVHGADLRTELSAGDSLRLRFARGSEAAELDVRVVDVHHESTASGLARVEVEAEVLNSTEGSILMESEREDYVSEWSQLKVLMSGDAPDAVAERLVRLVDEEPDAEEDEAGDEGEEFETAADRLRQEVEEAPEFSREDAGVPAEGERVAVTYESVYAERDKVLTAEVETVEHAPGSLNGRLWHVYLVPEGERDERKEDVDSRPPRRLTFMPEADSVTLDTRNGARWNRLNAPATNASVEVLAEGEEPEREPIGTVAVKVRHSRCGGTTLLTVDSVEEAEDLKGRVLACPHCHGEDEETGEDRRHELGTEFEFEAIRPLASHPNEVDPIHDLENHEVVEHHASPRRWEVYMEAGVKGRNRAHLAEDLGVSSGTVYRHVHDAREAIEEVTGQ